MGMTIEHVNKLLSVITATITEDDDCFTIEDENLQVFKEALLIAIDTMRKYQKVEQIHHEWFKTLTSAEAFEKISEVLNGNDN